MRLVIANDCQSPSFSALKRYSKKSCKMCKKTIDKMLPKCYTIIRKRGRDKYFPEGVWQVAISSDKTLRWSDQTGRALSAKVENKKIPTSQKNLLTNPLECDTIRVQKEMVGSFNW